MARPVRCAYLHGDKPVVMAAKPIHVQGKQLHANAQFLHSETSMSRPLPVTMQSAQYSLVYRMSSTEAIMSRKRCRFSFDIHFVSVEEREVFLERVRTVRQRMTPAGSTQPLDNYHLIKAMLDKMDSPSEAELTEASCPMDVVPIAKSMMRSNGKQWRVHGNEIITIFFYEPYF